MTKMKSKVVVLALLLALAATARGLSLPEDDLVFDDVVEETSSPKPEPPSSSHSAKTASTAPKKWKRVEKLLGLPDAVAAVGHVFKLHIPKQAFSGSVDYYKVQGINGKTLAHWLRWDEPASALYGVPSRKDVGRTRITIKAIGKQGDVAEDSFIVHVVPERREHVKYNDDKKRCSDDQDRIMVTILADTKYESLRPRDKVNALENLAGFLGLPTKAISIQPEIGKESETGGNNQQPGSSSGGPSDGDVILSGPGNVGRRQEKHSTILQWQIGCNGHFWPRQMDMVKQLSEQARDGTLSEVTQLRVWRWRIRNEPTDYARNRREIAGSGDDFGTDTEDDYEDENEEDYDYDSSEGITSQPPARPTPVAGGDPARPRVDPGLDEHPHRHHHGEDSLAEIGAGGEDFDTDEDDIWVNRQRLGLGANSFNATSTSASTPSTTIAVTLPSSTTTETTTESTTESTTTTATTTTTTTAAIESTSTSTTTEPPTEPSTSSSSSSESTSSASSSEIEEESSPSSESSSTPTSTTSTTTTTTTTTTETPETFNETVETLPELNVTNTSTFTNLTQIFISNSNVTSGNITTDSMTTDIDEEDPLTTDPDFDNETINEIIDVVSTAQPTSNVFVTSESTVSGGSNGPSMASGGAFSEPMTTAEPNATSVFSVNVTAEEYPVAPETYPGLSTTSTPSYTAPVWNENATDKGESLNPYDSMHVSVVSSTETTSTSFSTTTQSTTSTTTEATTTSTTEPPTSPTTESTTPSTTPKTTTTTEATTTTSTTPSTTTLRENYTPELRRKLKKISITQGKPLSYVIPEDTFSDIEDGNTRQLQLKVKENGASLKPTYWLQFNEETQEVYGLPLRGPPDQYGFYPFDVIATDSEGKSVTATLEITVQQHKQDRAVNHEFSIYLKFEKKSAFPTELDWELKVLRRLAELYGDHDASHITVRSVTIDRDQAIFSWMNDTLVRSSDCPHEEIEKLLKVLVREDKSEEPSYALENLLGPEIRVKRVHYTGSLQCETKVETKETPTNSNPIPRNQIDQLNATVGQLFVYKVPEDTFYDEEDGVTSKMKASLVTANRTEIPRSNWLQFDSGNQEFFGVPLENDVGQKTYQLVVKDSQGLEATDSLVAQVHSLPLYRHVLEIKMVLSAAYESFIRSAEKKRTFIEKLKNLYGDKNTNAISILSITPSDGATAILWRNLTLQTDRCPSDEVTRLKRVLIDEENKFTDELNNEFNSDSQNDFSILQITSTLTNACHDIKVKGIPEAPPVDDSTGGLSFGARYDEYLITFVLPAVIIAAMILLAGLIACILYKKRRSGKMSISEKDDERQSFRSKGIPVIFQDELEEKPDPGNKSPIILKEEKPPLPPPEYQREQDGADIPMLSKEGAEEPYQPPPPFATARDSNSRNRPKPTPMYRKPPPYVPP